MRLIEQHARLAPSALLVAPIAELTGHDWVDISADLRISQDIDGILVLQE
jgi:hypothetical protein